MVNRLILWVMLLGLAVPGLSQQPPAAPAPPLSAFVDRTDISINDVFTLTIRIDAALGNTRPSLAGLNRDFEQVGGIATRSTYTNNNGNIQSWTEYSIMLRPLTTGALTIPAFRAGSQVSNPIRVNVGEATQSSNTGNDEIYLESGVSKDEIYVQEQLLYTIKIFYSIGFDQGAQLSSPQVADAVVQQLGSDDNYQQVVNGIGYNVTERRFVIFPQSSGELIIPPVNFSASVGRRSGINRFFNSTATMREINLTSDTHTINVLPRPANVPGQTWLPAAQLTLEENWSGALDHVEIGDAITRNISLSAQGLSSSLLPGITHVDQPGLRFYPDQPVREDAADRNGVVGKRSEGTAIVASQAGTFVLPEVRLPWWNTVTNTLETAVLPEHTITVVAPANAANPVAPGVEFVPIPGQDSAIDDSMTAASQTSGVYLFWISATVVFASAWLFSTLMWLRSRRQLAYAELVQPAALARGRPEKRSAQASAQFPDPAACLRVLQTACNNDKLPDIKKALLKWGQASFQNHGILTLDQLALRCRNERISHLLAALDQALYGMPDNSFNSKELYAEIAALHKHGVAKDDSNSKYGLPPLYKN